MYEERYLPIPGDINKEFSKEHKNGVTIITGRLVVTLTNTVTRQSVTYNISGPVHITSQTGWRPTVPGPLAAVQPRHRHAGELGPRGHHLRPRHRCLHGGELARHVEDVCAALAP
jgi:hypothetical protein